MIIIEFQVPSSLVNGQRIWGARRNYGSATRLSTPKHVLGKPKISLKFIHVSLSFVISFSTSTPSSMGKVQGKTYFRLYNINIKYCVIQNSKIYFKL